MARHKCQECGKTFNLKRYLTKHEIRHKNAKKPEEPVKSFKCNMCDKIFQRVSHLQRHQMTHFNVRDYACTFCEDKFAQKAHLTRHITRKHSEAAGVEVKWIACDKCGHLFKTTYEIKLHRRTVHELHRCKQCKEVVEAGNDGLRQHHIRCRTGTKMCEHCGAAFNRAADLYSHQTSCLNKVEFECIPCNSYFKQRTQLDRHIKMNHFRSSKCSNCSYTSETPMQNSRHALECRKAVICGYCNMENPSVDHVKESHWHRLKRAVPKRVAQKEKKNENKHDKDSPGTSDAITKKSVEDIDDDMDDGTLSGTSDNNESKDEEEESELKGDKQSEKKDEDSPNDNESLFDFPETSNSQLDFCSSAFEEDDTPEEYITFSISPKDADLSYHLRGRLSAPLVALFPELENTSIVLLNSVISSRCRMTVRVPVCIPKSSDKEAEMRKWLENTIFLDVEK